MALAIPDEGYCLCDHCCSKHSCKLLAIVAPYKSKTCRNHCSMHRSSFCLYTGNCLLLQKEGGRYPDYALISQANKDQAHDYCVKFFRDHCALPNLNAADPAPCTLFRGIHDGAPMSPPSEEVVNEMSTEEVALLKKALPGYDGSVPRTGFERRAYLKPADIDEASYTDVINTMMNILLLKAKYPGYAHCH